MLHETTRILRWRQIRYGLSRFSVVLEDFLHLKSPITLASVLAEIKKIRTRFEVFDTYILWVCKKKKPTAMLQPPTNLLNKRSLLNNLLNILLNILLNNL